MAFAKVIRVIVVESVIGDGTENNPSRDITEYFTVDGEFLSRVDQWKENTKAQTEHVDILVKSQPLVDYVNKLKRTDNVIYGEGESVWDVVLRCWKADRELLRKFSGGQHG